MTELMKRYEAETGERATFVYTWEDSEGNEKHGDITTGGFDVWAIREAERLNEENSKLKEQLTWRPVSEKPKENVDVEVCDMSKPSLDEREPVIAYYEKGKWICLFPYNYDVYAYITPTHWRYIPPAPEGVIA